MTGPESAPTEADDLTFRRYPLRWLVWLLDEALDLIPAWEEGRFYRKGGWGCRLRLDRWWVPPSWNAAEKAREASP